MCQVISVGTAELLKIYFENGIQSRLIYLAYETERERERERRVNL